MGLRTALNEKIESLRGHKTPAPVFHSFALDHVDEPLDQSPAEMNKQYFRLWLSEVYLPYDRRWFQRYYPMVSSLVNCTFNHELTGIPALAGEFQLPQFSSARPMHAVYFNYALSTLIPLKGMTVEIIAALFAMPGKNYLTQFIKVMSDFSHLLNVPHLSAVLNVADKLAGGIEELLGLNGKAPLLGFHQTFTDKDGINPLKDGYILVPLASEAQIKPERLWVVNKRLRSGPSLTENVPVTEYAYMLLRIETRTTREDWEAFKSLWQAMKRAIQELQYGQPASKKAQSYIRAAIDVASALPDFTFYDANSISRHIQTYCANIQKQTPGQGAVPVVSASLADIMSLYVPETSIPADHLLAFGEIFPEFET